MDFVTELNRDPRVVIVRRHQSSSYVYFDVYLISNDSSHPNFLHRCTWEVSQLLKLKYDMNREAMKVAKPGYPTHLCLERAIQRLIDKPVKFQVI